MNAEKHNENKLKKGKINKKKKAVIIAVIAVIVVCIVILGCLFAASHKKSDDKVKKNTPSSSKTVAKKKTEEKKEIDWNALETYNPDIYAWLYIPDTSINFAVLQPSSDKDDDYYLNHNTDGSYGYPGAVYSQKRNSKDFTDRMTVLYGHNMKNGTMFKPLHAYEKEDYLKKHQYIYIYTKDKTYVYQIFAAYTYDDRLILDYFDDFKDDNTWKTYLHSFNELYSGIVEHDIKLKSDDRILTLSTCTSVPDERFLVQGKLLSDTETSALGDNKIQKANTCAAKASEELVSGNVN